MPGWKDVLMGYVPISGPDGTRLTPAFLILSIKHDDGTMTEETHKIGDYEPDTPLWDIVADAKAFIPPGSTVLGTNVYSFDGELEPIDVENPGTAGDYEKIVVTISIRSG